jgi:hypothetical protein
VDTDPLKDMMWAALQPLLEHRVPVSTFDKVMRAACKVARQYDEQQGQALINYYEGLLKKSAS